MAKDLDKNHNLTILVNKHPPFERFWIKYRKFLFLSFFFFLLFFKNPHDFESPLIGDGLISTLNFEEAARNRILERACARNRAASGFNLTRVTGRLLASPPPALLRIPPTFNIV